MSVERMKMLSMIKSSMTMNRRSESKNMHQLDSTTAGFDLELLSEKLDFEGLEPAELLTEDLPDITPEPVTDETELVWKIYLT